MFDCPARIKTFTGPLKSGSNRSASASWANSEFATNDIATIATTIAIVVFLFMLVVLLQERQEVKN